jgi:hypothetical protein
MSIDEQILEHTKEHYPRETKTIERSMINYYHSRMNEDKTEQEIFHQQMIYNGVIDLFELLAIALEDEMNLGISRDCILQHLKDIHIKT